MTAKLLLCLALAQHSFTASAATWQLPNQAGGQIVLTDTDCLRRGFDPLLQAYGYAADGSAELGCWAVLDGLVHVSWANGSRSIYPMDGFVAKPGTIKPYTPGQRAPASPAPGRTKA